MKCSICGEDLNGYYGNNPDPIRTADTARCCDECNSRFVIPARIILMSADMDKQIEISKKLNECSYEELCNIFN